MSNYIWSYSYERHTFIQNKNISDYKRSSHLWSNFPTYNVQHIFILLLSLHRILVFFNSYMNITYGVQHITHNIPYYKRFYTYPLTFNYSRSFIHNSNPSNNIHWSPLLFPLLVIYIHVYTNIFISNCTTSTVTKSHIISSIMTHILNCNVHKAMLNQERVNNNNYMRKHLHKKQ